MRKLSGRTSFTKRLHNISGVCAILVLIFLLAFRDFPYIWKVFSYILIGSSILAFIIETRQKIEYLKKWWDTWPGKIIYSAIALAFAFVSALISKQIIHDITGVNPIYFPEFIGLLSILITVLLIINIIQVAVFILSLGHMIRAYGTMIISTMFIPFVLNIDNLLAIFARIISGKKEKYPSLVLVWYPMSMLFGAMALIYIISFPMSLLTAESKTIKSFLTKGLVYT